MRVCDDNSGASSFFKIPDPRFEEMYKTVRVKTIRLDDFLKAHSIENIDLLCVDVEGASFQVIESLGDELKKVKYIILELEHTTVYSGEVLFQSTDSYLRTFGFIRTAQPYRFANGALNRTEDFLYINNSALKTLVKDHK